MAGRAPDGIGVLVGPDIAFCQIKVRVRAVIVKRWNDPVIYYSATRIERPRGIVVGKHIASSATLGIDAPDVAALADIIDEEFARRARKESIR
jgi:hypothetical protein